MHCCNCSRRTAAAWNAAGVIGGSKAARLHRAVRREIHMHAARCSRATVTALGKLPPLNDPSRAPSLLVPSCTLAKSQLASVVKLLKLRVMAEPVEIVHEQALWDV